MIVPWGNNATDMLSAMGDYDCDCDGTTDPTYVRDVNDIFVWGIKTSGPGPDRTVTFGSALEDIPLVGLDWTGNGCADLAVINIGGSGDTTYRIADAVTGAIALEQAWGSFNTDFSIPGDFIGDERPDFAVWRAFGSGTSGAWMIKENGGPGTLTQVFGTPGSSAVRDTPLRGDYDGDGKDDIAVQKKGTATWQWRRSSDGAIDQTTVGAPCDLPAPSFGVQ